MRNDRLPVACLFRFPATAASSLLAFGLVALTSATGQAQLPAIELTELSRTAGTIGSAFELRLRAGSRLDEVETLRFSDPAVTAELLTTPPLPRTDSPLPDHGHFRVKIPAGTSTGRIEVRAVGRHGISNPRILRLTEYPCSVVEPVSHDWKAPTEFPRERLLLARCTPAEIDYFAVPVDKGESVRIRLSAQTIDSRMIGQLVLLDQSGNIVRSSRGADGIDPEVVLRRAAEKNIPPHPTLSPTNLAARGGGEGTIDSAARLRSEPSGEYTLAVHDFLHRGGDEFPYQLLIESIPEDDDSLEPNPKAGRNLVNQSFRSVSDQSSGRLPDQIHLNAFALRSSAERSLQTHWLASGASERGEDFTASLPARVAGHFDARYGAAGEQRVVEFEAEQGQQWAVDVYADRLGQPTDVRLIIERFEADGSDGSPWRQVEVFDDSQAVGDVAISLRTTDPVGIFQVPQTGRYRAIVRDLDTGDALGSRQYFVLEVRRPDPGFDLLAYSPNAHNDLNQSKPVGVNLVRRGSESFRVFAVRRDGWAGAIELTFEGLPEGISCSPVWIPANQNHATLNVVVSPEAESWTGSVRLLGRAKVADQARTVEAVPATVQWAKSGSRPFIRSRLASEMTLAVSDQDVSPVSVQWGDEETPEATPGSTLTIPVRLTRQDNGKGACILRPKDLPPGVSAGEVTIPADQSEAVVELKIADNAAPGTYTPWLQGETPVTWQSNPQRLERAERYLAHLQEQLGEAESDEERSALEAAIKVAEERIEAAKPSANPQTITLFLPSNNTTFQVVSQ